MAITSGLNELVELSDYPLSLLTRALMNPSVCCKQLIAFNIARLFYDARALFM